MRRASGILLHVTSLPSSFGVGDLGPWAYRFADFLAAARQSYWQVLPLNPTAVSHGNSPYNSNSAFAGNTLLISPELLVEEELLKPKELEQLPPFPGERVDYGAAALHKTRLLDKAFRRREERGTDNELEKFCRDHDGWLDDYSLFVALKDQLPGETWRDWPAELRDRSGRAMSRWKGRLREKIEKEKFYQYLFFRQWAALRRYCNGKNILLIGDVPIYVSADSADVWANPEIFKLDSKKRPSVVAGVPPDYFSATGQLWGNPVYRWEALKAGGYEWWLKRLRQNLAWCDKIRLDHFRGFVACWEVPVGASTATSGRWVEAPAVDFFSTLIETFPGLPVFVEDLGLITPDVHKVRERFGFPGMKVLLFAFGEDPAKHPYAPHNHEKNSVVYTGTHDTNTVRGWYEDEASPKERERFFAYVGRPLSAEEIHWEMIRLALGSPADTAILPMQDVLGLGAEARMNRPATMEGNWRWRLLPEQWTPALSAKLAEVTEKFKRASPPAERL